MLDHYLEKGWCRFPFDPVLHEWIETALPVARKAVASSDNAQWFRYQNTWFAGVNVFPNDTRGVVGNGSPLQGKAIDFINQEIGINHLIWDKAQISVCYPGYPKPMPSESEAVFQYRIKRDAAHVDGLLKEGNDRKRYLREHHAFILGIPLVGYSEGASPPVVWQGSHKIVRSTFKDYFADMPSENWKDIDVSNIYQETRRTIFQQCERVEIKAKPGEAYLIHRLALHGMAPWGKDATATKEGRMICYFRPAIGTAHDWLLIK